MAKLGVFTISGKSGLVYEFDAYPLNTVWTPVSGVYIVTHRDVRSDGTAQHVCLSLGQARNLQILSSDPATWPHAHRANCICLLEETSEAQRKMIVTDIAGANAFPL